MLIQAQAFAPDCRVAVVPACEADSDANNAQAQTVQALGLFQMRVRDTIDFQADFTQWLAANGAPLLTNAAWTVAATSPKTPTIAGQGFVPAGMTAVVLSVPSGGAPGDTYYLDITVHIAATVPSLPTAVAIPARILVRRVNVIVVAG